MSNIVRQPRMIETARQPFGPAAIALIEPDDVPPRGPRLVGNAAHVVGHAGTLEAVKQDKGRCAAPKVTMCKHPGVRRHVEIPLNGRRESGKLPGPGPGVQRLLMAAGEPWPV